MKHKMKIHSLSLFAFNICLFICFSFFLISQSTVAQTTYRQRADSVITFFKNTDFGKDYYSVIAKLKTDENYIRALSILDTLLQKPAGDATWMMMTISVYLHGADKLPASYKKTIRDFWKTNISLCKDTEHDRVMYYTSFYLATESFDQNETEWFNGKSTAENKSDAYLFLQQWFEDATTKGMEEFDSPSITGNFFACMSLLYDFAKDQKIKKQSEIMLDWLIADFAPEYLDGMYCGAHSREPEFAVIDPRSSSMTAFASLLFGDIPLLATGDQLLLALSSYTPPSIFQTVATNRTEPFIQTEIKQSKDFYRNQTERKKEVYKYTYMSDLYSMGSIDGGLIQPVEQHSWDVSWKAKFPASIIFSVQPVGSDSILSQFYSSDENTAYQEIASQYTRYVTFNKNSDGSPYERFFQNKNTLIALYDIPAIKTFPIITAFFPRALDSFIVDSLKSHWIFCRSGDVYIAYFPFKGYTILDEENGRRLVSPITHNGLICQVSSKKESGTFKKFISMIKKSKVDLKKFDDEKRVTYTTIKGDKMEFVYDGVRKLNDQEVRFDSENLFQSKWMNSKKGSGVLTITDGQKILTLDMQHVSIDEK